MINKFIESGFRSSLAHYSTGGYAFTYYWTTNCSMRSCVCSSCNVFPRNLTIFKMPLFESWESRTIFSDDARFQKESPVDQLISKRMHVELNTITVALGIEKTSRYQNPSQKEYCQYCHELPICMARFHKNYSKKNIRGKIRMRR